jgi:hypothetical protein
LWHGQERETDVALAVTEPLSSFSVISCRAEHYEIPLMCTTALRLLACASVRESTEIRHFSIFARGELLRQADGERAETHDQSKTAQE